ncbi:hypothetical protein [Bacillus sp. REN3]|uniref:hypothetical protein n=1 Tax=Bacillus sp. REN3 TaxID=2802440 RepID=UPI001AEDD081|nr:hypothetical protein [Bacillus sp. REN3]
MKANAHLKTRVKGAGQTNPLVFRYGLWIDGKMHWAESSMEKSQLLEDLSIRVRLLNLHSRVEYLKFYVTNQSRLSKEAKLIILQCHANPAVEQFCFVSPAEEVIFHLAGNSIYLVNGMNSEGKMKQCTVQPLWNLGTDRLWRCEESGRLNYQPLAKGASVSLFSLDLSISPFETQECSCWAIEGSDINILIDLNKLLLKNRLAFSEKK